MRFKPYPKYKPSGVEWLGEVPEAWVVTRVKEVANLINGYPFDSSKFDPLNGIPLVRIRDIFGGSTDVFWNGEAIPDAEILNGDILIGMDGDFNVALWNSGYAMLNQRVCCLRSENSDTQKFLFYSLPTPVKMINDLTYSTTVKHLSSVDVGKVRVALPAPDEQSAIASFLDRETAKIDTLISKQEKLIELLKEKRQAVISHAVTKGLNPNVKMKDSGIGWLGVVPEHWDVVQFKYLVDIQNGSDHKHIEQSEGYPVIGSGGVFAYASDYMYDGESVLLGRKGTIDKPLYIVGRFWTVDTMYWTKISPNVSGRFAYYQALTIPFDYYSTNTALPSMTKGNLSSHLVTRPLLQEQSTIATFLDLETAKIDTLISKAEQAIVLQREHRIALISAAVTGKIDVREAV